MTWVLSCQEMPGGVESETICRTQDPGEADWSLRALWIPGCGLPSLPDPALSTLAPCISASAEKMPSAGPTPLQGQRGHPPPSHSAQCVHAMLWTVARQAPLSMGFPDKNTGVGCHFLLQGLFPTQGWNPRLLCLLRWKVGSLPLLRREYWSGLPCPPPGDPPRPGIEPTSLSLLHWQTSSLPPAPLGKPHSAQAGHLIEP